MSCPPAGDVANTIERAKEPIPLHINRASLRTKKNNRQAEALIKTPSIGVAAAVDGTRSIARFHLLIGLVPCYPVCRLRPAFVNYAPPPKRIRLTTEAFYDRGSPYFF